jgi:hypothetical protein
MTMRKSLVNYTTEVSTERTIAEIEQILVRFGAMNISKMYDNGQPSALAFQYMVNNQPLLFKLPMEKDKIMQVFNNQVNRGIIPKRYLNNEEQSNRVGWRILLLWVQSQISLLEIHTVKLEQVFLPFLFDLEHNETLFEKLERKGFDLQIGYDKND